MDKEPMTPIQFSKIQTAVSVQYLIHIITELAKIEQARNLIGKLSIVLAVMRKCHEAAPDIPNLAAGSCQKVTGWMIK